MKPVAIVLPLLLSAFAFAQEAAPQRTLQSLLREHRAAIAKASQSEDPKAFPKAFALFVTALREYLEHDAKGEDIAFTRFQLVHALLSSGKRPDAEKALEAFDTNKATAVQCAEAAYLATTMRKKALAQGWIQVALAKKSKKSERMELGILLMSRLHQPKLGKALFDEALAAATGSEAKAEVEWHRARATREREDLPEGSYEKALHRLAKDYPKTRYGSIARDRLTAMDFKIGAAPLPLAVKTLAGAVFELQAHKGHPVIVCFWHSEDQFSDTAMKALKTLQARHETQGLKILGISLDKRIADARAKAKIWNAGIVQAHVEGGYDADLALRYRVEDTPFCFLVGHDGKLAGLNFALADDFGVKELAEAVGKSVAAKR